MSDVLHTHVNVLFYDRKSEEGPFVERKGLIGAVKRAKGG